MGAISNCCCNPCDPCEQFAEVTNWQITTPLFGFTLAGTFGDLLSTCKKAGQDCERGDNILHDQLQVIGDWGGWLNLWACQGPCINCADPSDPGDGGCSIDLVTGQLTCPPTHPTYPGEEYSVRSSIWVKFWYSKMVWVEVEIQYVTPTTVKFFATIVFTAGSELTYSSRTQQRRRSATYQCTTGLRVATGTPTDPGSGTPPEPLEPCVSLLGDPITSGTCADPVFNSEPNPCESATTETISYTCVELVNFECETVNRSVSFTTDFTHRCCDRNFCPPFSTQSVSLMYESSEYPCNDIPSSIPLNVVGTESDLTIDWNCTNIDTPDPLTLTIPSTINLQVS